MSFMQSYKVGQGKQARTFAALLIIGVAAWGCYTFFEYSGSKLDRLLMRDTPLFSKPLIEGGSDITTWITPGMIVAVVLFLAVWLWARSFVNKPSVADHLIGTELEMRRVKWPTKPEVLRAGTLVIYYVFWSALIIFIMDMTMNTLIGVLLGQDFEKVGFGKLVYGLVDFFSQAKGT